MAKTSEFVESLLETGFSVASPTPEKEYTDFDHGDLIGSAEEYDVRVTHSHIREYLQYGEDDAEIPKAARDFIYWYLNERDDYDWESWIKIQ